MRVWRHIVGWVLGNAFGTFLGAEAVKGWILGDGHAWLGSLDDWPLYLALSVACVLSFVAANWYMGTKFIGYCRIKKQGRRVREGEKEKETQKKIRDFCALLMQENRSVESSSKLYILHEQLHALGLSPPLDIANNDAVMHYHRMIPYIEEYGLDRARNEARRWWKSKKKIEAKASLAPIQTSANVGKRAAPDVFTRIKNWWSSNQERRHDGR